MENVKNESNTKEIKSNGKDNSNHLYRQPSIKKKKGPVVRQTLTSYKRMLKANPLLKYEGAGIDIINTSLLQSMEQPGSTSKSATLNSQCSLKSNSAVDGKQSLDPFKRPDLKTLKRTQSLKLPKSNGINTDLASIKTSIISGNRPLTNYLKKHESSNAVIDSNTKQIKNYVTSKGSCLNVPEGAKQSIKSDIKIIKEVKAKVNSFPKITSNKQPIPSATTTCTISNGVFKNKQLSQKSSHSCKPSSKPLRRSLSSGHLQSKKGKPFDPHLAYSKPVSSQSEENISNLHVSSTNHVIISPIIEESNNSSKQFVFKTPSAYERRSVCHFTPRSIKKNYVLQSSTPAPIEKKRLQERLSLWLKARGKELPSFHHLRCFGIDHIKRHHIPSEVEEENKENFEVIQEKSDSYEELKIESSPPSNTEEISNKVIPAEQLRCHAKEALVELQKLVEEDYPRAQCLGWLELIGEKYDKIAEEPEYWECRAAIEQSAGNVHNAVEYYKTAIIQGAEVHSVDKSLDQLLKKFSLLNISPEKTDKKMELNRDKERIIREARNVFKSTIIQFAIRERKFCKKTTEETDIQQKGSTKLVVTPVRRSTRLSRSGFISTPGVKLCQSLREIDLSTEEIGFEKNSALC